MREPILIFPAGMPRSLAYLAKCQQEGAATVGASSLANDPTRLQYSDWAVLPYITDDGFDSALLRLIETRQIGGIYTPHPIIWNYLNEHLPRLSKCVSLVNVSPVASDLASHRRAVVRGRDLVDSALSLSSTLPPKKHLAQPQVTALYKHSEDIPGMCDHEKIRALYEVFRHCPRGDIVEIGTWWGKSAFVLLWLARCFDIGNVLCVDPWSDFHLVQHDEGALVDTLSSQLNAEEAFEVFLGNMSPYVAGNLNYVRIPSTEGEMYYSSNHVISSQAFGTTSYSGEISLLHIDGNHAYDSVHADLHGWRRHMKKSGWIVIDDYTWPFGDGPKRVGDDFLANAQDQISTSFVMGGALFIQLSSI